MIPIEWGNTRKKPENSKIMCIKKLEHQYEDYKNYISENPQEIVAQLDTVEGKKLVNVFSQLK